MKTREKTTDVLSILRNIDFKWSEGFDYDYDSNVAPDHYERCANDYCRCSTIENACVTSIDYKGIAKAVINEFDIVYDKELNSRVINDIEKVCKTITKDDFYCDVCGGYYGEELDSITLDNSIILKRLEEVIDLKKARKAKLNKLNDGRVVIDSEIVKDILIKEYGYLLDDLVDADFSVIDVDTSDIVLPNREYADKVKNSDLSGYKNHRGICGVVRYDNGKYRVIDGYHRVTVNLKKSKIKVILYE
jgi:hypothetical protein